VRLLNRKTPDEGKGGARLSQARLEASGLLAQGFETLRHSAPKPQTFQDNFDPQQPFE
jgi:hypothetical protein